MSISSARLNYKPYASRRVWIPRFNLETNIRFIEEYRKHPCLWDPGDPYYMKHKPRYRSYEEIAKAMNYPGLDAASVRAKIKILRSCYISSRKQIASKAGTSTPHKPVDWFWAADSFLHDVIRLGFSEPSCISEEYQYLRENFETSAANASATEAEVYFGSNSAGSGEEIVETLDVYDDDDEEDERGDVVLKTNIKTEVIEEADIPDNSIYLELDDEQLMAIENGEISIEDVAARAEAQHQQRLQEEAAAAAAEAELIKSKPRLPRIRNLSKIPESKEVDDDDDTRSRTAESEEDEFIAFGRCVALQLKTLPIEAALDLESQIHSLITKKRMSLLRQKKLHWRH